MHYASGSMHILSIGLPFIFDNVLNDLFFENIQFITVSNGFHERTSIFRNIGDHNQMIENLVLLRGFLGSRHPSLRLFFLVMFEEVLECSRIRIPNLEDRFVEWSKAFLDHGMLARPLIKVESVVQDTRLQKRSQSNALVQKVYEVLEE